MKNKIVKFLPALVFLLVTFGFCILFFLLPKSDFSVNEKRYLADTPKFSVENLISGELVKEIDGDSEKGSVGYVADHFPFRSFFVGLNSYYNLGLGNTANSDYYFAKDGFIITKPYGTQRLDTNIRVINSFAEDKNVTLCVVPSPGNILEDKLPKNHLSYKDDVVYETLSSQLSEDVSYCDVNSVLKAMQEKGNAPFYKTDHHWTTPAAYNAYVRLADNLGYIPATESDFKKELYSGFYGTTYSSSGYFLAQPDTIEVWSGKAEESVSVEIHELGEVKTSDSMFFESHLSEPDMYPVFLDGNHALVKIKNQKADGGKLLVIKDSFAHALTPFLAENFSEIIMIDLRYYKENVTELCETEGIEDVLVLYSISNFCTDTSLAFLE